MKKLQRLKIKTSVEMFFVRLFRLFDRKVNGIGAKYDVAYASDKNRRHRLDVLYPTDKSGLPCVVYLHGGGWSVYDKCVFRATCKRLAEGGTVVFNCNYRLAPQFSVEQMLQDITSVLQFIRRTAASYHGDPQKIVFAGDSSGAHLLALYLNRAFCNGDKDIVDAVKACAFFYGAYDLETVRYTEFRRLNEYMESILPKDSPDYERRLKELSPVRYLTEGLPPTLLCSGEVDKLHASQSARYAEELEKRSVSVRKLFFPKERTDAAHRFITYADSRAAKDAFRAFEEFIRETV